MKRTRRGLQIAGLVVGGGILLWQIWNGVMTLRQEPALSLTPRLLLAVPFVLGAIFVQIIAWSSAMQSLGVHLPIREVLQGYLLSFLPRYIPGTVWGYLSRSEWLYQNYGISYKVSNQGSAAETLSAIIANGMVIALFALLRQPGWLPYLAGALIFVPLLSGLFLRLLAHLRWPGESQINQLLGLLFPELRLGYWQASVAYFFLHWLLNGAGLLLVYNAVQADRILPTLSTLMHFSYIYAFGWVVGFLILFVPAGIGFREFALTNLLSSGFGISSGLGSMIAVLFRLTILACEAIGLAVGLLVKKASPGSGVE